MADGEGEFDRIEKLMAPLAIHPGAENLKNDGASITPSNGFELVITTDTIIEGVHYLKDTPPELVAAKLLGVNLSDVAAMGARPLGYMLNCSYSEKHDYNWCEKFANELQKLQTEYDFSLLGGDTTKTHGAGVFSLSAFGEVETGRILKRKGAKAGDLIYVSQTIGDSALGLKAALGEITDQSGFLADRYHRPQPRINLGRSLVGIANTCLDISDGLAQDLGHICHQSGVGAVIEIDKIPLSMSSKELLNENKQLISLIISGGDDYELLFTLSPENEKYLREVQAKTGLELTKIGTITTEKSIEFQNQDGKAMELDQSGFRHF